MATFHWGSLVRVTITFQTAAGIATDPAIVKAQVRSPAGAVTTYQYGVDAALTKTATGIYALDVDASMVGTWFVRGFSLGSGRAAEESGFIVTESQFD